MGPAAGTTTIIPVVSGSGQTNFAITLVNGSFAISKADSVTTVSCPASVTYKGSAWTPCTATVSGAGGLNQTLTVSYTNNINAGTATASASFAGDANHNASSDSKTFQINKVTLTVTADNKTRVYGAANPTSTASYSGFVGGQTLATSGITGTPALSTTADANSPVGTYPIVAALGTLSSANYNFTFVNGTLTITQATLTITALNVSKTYGDVYTFSNGCPSINCSITGLAPSDTIAGVILTSTGAAGVPLEVKRAALTACVASHSNKPRSGLPLGFISHATPAARKPRGRPLPAGSSRTCSGRGTQRDRKNACAVWVALKAAPRSRVRRT